MEKKSKIFVAGHRGMVGSAIVKDLENQGYTNIIYKTSSELNLINQQAVASFFESEKPEYVFLAAAKVGGIIANNTYRADFIYENILIQSNVIHQSYLNNVKKLLFLGSTCIYPKLAPQPLKEDYLLTGLLEETNEPYAIAKIAGIKMCESYNRQYKTNFKCLMPCNLYGPNDNYNLDNSHFLPALIKKISNAKFSNNHVVHIWGTGKPKREVMYVEDLADACLYFLQKKTTHSLINIGSGIERSILDYAKIIAKIFNKKIHFKFDKSKPDGMKRKLVDTKLAKTYGWKSKTTLEEGLKLTIAAFKNKKN